MRRLSASVLALVAVPSVARADVTIFSVAPMSASPLVAVPIGVAVDRAASPQPIEAPQPVEAAQPLTPIAPAAPIEAIVPPTPPSLVTPPSPAALPPTERCEAPSAVRFVRMTDGSRDHALLRLTDCHGLPDPDALRELSILARPRTAARPSARDLAAHRDDREYFAPDVRRLDPGLLVRLARIAERFPGHDIEITSGYRPDARSTSQHRVGHALDLRVEGVSIYDVHALALTFDETGVGLYPTTEFLHLDVRPRVTRWVDTSGPGEPSNMIEVVTGRDGVAANAPPLAFTPSREPAP